MDQSNPESHRHKIDASNYIEYRGPYPNQVKYSPPSPTTSGYSESGSEMDNHDSGRVSEMENSPKMNTRRPTNIALSMGVFNPGEGHMSPRDPFSEGKSTIRTAGNSNPSLNKSFSGDYSVPLDAYSKQSERSSARKLPKQGDTVLVSAEALRSLITWVHDARTRLNTVEGKVDGLVRAAQLQRKQSNSAMIKLTKSILSLGDDFNSVAASRELENGRIPKKFQPHVNHLPKVPVSNNNDNVPCSVCSTHSRFQSSAITHNSPHSSSGPAHKTSTFPRFPRNQTIVTTSVAPSNEHDDEYYDNMADEQDMEAKHPLESKNERRPSNYVNDDVIKQSSNDDPSKAYKHPVYAVVRKKKSVEQVEPSYPPSQHNGLLTSPPDDVNHKDDLEQLLREMTGTFDEPPPSPDELTNTYESLTRVSRFSEVESLFSDFENSPSINDVSTVAEEDRSLTDTTEGYKNRPATIDRTHEKINGDIPNLLGSEPKSHADRDVTPESRATTLTNNQSSNAKDVATSENMNISELDRYPESAHKISRSWHDFENVISYASDPKVERVTVLQPVSKGHFLSRGRSVDSLREEGKSLSSVDSDSSRPRSKKKGKRSNLAKNSDEKKSNVLVSNVNRFFKRKNKPKANRSVSQNSFTFVDSPLYDPSLSKEAVKKTPSFVRRNESAESLTNSKFDLASSGQPLSSLSNLTSSQEGSADLTPQNDLEPLAPKGSNEKFTGANSPPIEQFDNISLGEFDNVTTTVNGAEADSTDDYLDEKAGPAEMRPNIIKIAKKALRNNSILQRNKKASSENNESNSSKSSPKDEVKPPDDVMPTSGQTYIHYDVTDDDVFIPSGVIYERQQREQADRLRFETDRPRAVDEPPPKPNRPGFSHGGAQGSPRSSTGAHGAPNGGVPGSGMYAQGRGMPAVPPKTKIMTPEELTNHEAHEKLRLKQMEEAMLQQKLDEQQRQAEENAKWLQQEEQMLFTTLKNPDNKGSNGEDAQRARGSSNSLSDMQAPPPPSVAPSKPPRKTSRPKDEPAGPPQTKIQLEEVKTAPTMQLNRNDDAVYKDTMEVVKSVLSMNNITMNAKPEELFTSVKVVGAALKQLCTSLESTLPSLPEDFHREIDMAQKTTNKDLSQVINQLKLVQRFFTTTQVVDYKKCLMAANQVLAIDAKNLLDVVDRARIRKIQEAQENASRAAQGATSHPGNYEPGELYPTDVS